MCKTHYTEACKGRYLNRRFRREVLPRLQAKQPILVESHVVKLLQQQGFSFDPKLDNKSEFDPDKLFDALQKYFDPVGWDPDWEAYDQAWALTAARFAKPEHEAYLELLPLKEVTDRVHLMKSSGAPYYVKKGDALVRDLEYALDISVGRVPPPCTAYHRIQHGDEGPKTRLVWGYPLSMTLIEGRAAAPLIASFLSRRSPMAFGMTKLGISARIRSIMNKDYQFGFDFSRFDSSISPKLIQRAFWILKTWFEPSEEKDMVFRLIENYFVFTPIVMPDGNIYVKERGVPSGSWFTQLVDSIVNYFAIQYAMITTHGPLVEDNLLVLGDDSLFGYYKDVNIERLAKRLSDIGLTMNPSKTAKSKDGVGTHFLGHDWSMSLPNRSLRETAKRMAFPERWTELDIGPEQRANLRIASYLADSLDAYQIYKDLPWNQLPSVVAIAQRAEQGPVLTGWQTFMQSISTECKTVTPAKLFFLGVCT